MPLAQPTVQYVTARLGVDRILERPVSIAVGRLLVATVSWPDVNGREMETV